VNNVNVNVYLGDANSKNQIILAGYADERCCINSKSPKGTVTAKTC
jgi:hypothetical protein